MEETQSVYNMLVLAVGTLAFLWAFLPRLSNANRKFPPEWAKKYGPIYSIRTGANTVIVLNSSELAKEALATKYSSISTRRLTKSLQILTRDKDNGGHKRLRWRAPHAQEAHTRISSGSCSSAQVGCGTEAKPFRSKRYEERVY